MSWLRGPDRYKLIEHDEAQHAISTRWAELAEALAATVRMIAPGIPVARRKGEAWAPHPALALNRLLDPQAFPAMDLDRKQAIQYLQGEALPATEAKGTALMRYQGLGLGWANGAGARWNNGWPAPWRIRMR